MQRLKCRVEYDGTVYAGYQVQTNGVTIQEKIEKALTKMHKGESVKVIASGRTDAGVHAIGQVIHFDTSLNIPASNWKRALGPMLPEDIRVAEVEPVTDDFHARYDTTAKEYRYYVWNDHEPNLFRRLYTYHIRKPLDVAAMREACKLVEGEHNFTSFCSPRTDLKGSKVRTITKAVIEQRGSELVFIFKGNGFLYNMVRILVGTILEVGFGDRTSDELETMLAARDRKAAGKTAPPHGLFLWKVEY
ncbi:tRNA pseudouridine(38-40) synthase TruA [Halobacillus shinanisalinarum]|uniref:tRNA pseudouridine synthase A n=1 Tax=Halobacillus shinanisalinarum TaxID=2932258 RepID=A0ABY4GVM8_9BACI|nr:tRNA pseudouridine(38-40) synthase TruA [Halobacillus shinanisalinarum]UOQ91442.1 tRNA pseudouridine(38-40) synthase TruA [Halobacillus shinanisalinarum]